MKNIYIHFPYCIQKCGYCDFYSVTDRSTTDLYVDALLKEIDLRCQHNRKFGKLDSIFFGGGTPSLMTHKHLSAVLKKIEQYFSSDEKTEVTIEANPGTINLKNLKSFKKSGVNRLSIGVQSFNQLELTFLGRIHNSDEAVGSIKDARSAGFENINLDLIYEIPCQTLKSWNETLDKALSFYPEHLSLYSLIYEKGTPLYTQLQKGKIKPISEELQSEFYFAAVNKLEDAKLHHYEVSNFARHGKKSKHNLSYWKGNDYLGFGTAAHGFINGVRYWNPKSLKLYFEKIENKQLPTEGFENLSRKDKLFEQIFLGLRASGIELKLLTEKYKIDLNSQLKTIVKELEKDKMINPDNRILKLTDKGYLFADEIAVRIMKKLEEKITF